MITLILMSIVVAILADPASRQLYSYRKEHMCPVILTNNNGAPVEMRDTQALNSDLISNEFFMDLASNVMQERIPERAVHAKGAGAFGYFEVTHNVTAFCKAKLFSEIGKITPLAVRFSQSSMDKGEADTILDSRGFACKFYTEEGNFDIVGFHTPMFMFREPFLFEPIGKCIRRNPVTNLRDPNMIWDLIAQRSELLNFFLFVFGKNSVPRGYRYMPGHSIHTYQIYNCYGETFFARFHITPDLGVENLSTEEAFKIAGLDPDYAVRDLYNAIECGDWPSWTLSWQLMTVEDVKNYYLDVFDMTLQIPTEDFPIQPIGKLYLNRNPINFFAEVEQMAFCPGNLVPGILGAPDKVFAARRFAYKNTQRHRLGSNFYRIHVNRPLSKLNVYDRDGRPPVADNGGSAPNYFPNSFNGPIPYVDENRPTLYNIFQRNDEIDNFRQPTELYIALSEEDRNNLVQNMVVWSLSRGATVDMQKRVVAICRKVHPDLGQRLKQALLTYKAPASPAYQCQIPTNSDTCEKKCT